MKAHCTYADRVFLIFCFFLLTNSKRSFAQWSPGFSAHYGFIFVHSDNVENTRNSRPYGVQFDLAKQKDDIASFSLCNCYPKTGFSFYYFNYDNKILGHGLSTAYFLEPAFRIKGEHLFVFRGTVGLSYLSHPHHTEKNPDNNSYSTRISALLGLGLGFNLRIHAKWRFQLMANYLHTSNGGIKDPNKGINWPTISAGLNYTQNGPLGRYQKQIKSNTPNTLRLDGFAFASSRIAAVGDKIRYGVYGAGVLLSQQLDRLNTITLGGEWHLDKAFEEGQKRMRIPPDGHFGGVGIGHEFILGRFLFSQQLNYYLLQPDNLPWNFYHRWGLTYCLTQHLQIGVNLKAHAQVAHFLDLRFAYNIRRQGKI